jgi:hypothetical protein
MSNRRLGMDSTLRSEKGVALIMALGAIVVISVLIGGIVFVTTQDTRIGANTMRAAQAAEAAEMGLNSVPANWSLADNSRLGVGDTMVRTDTGPGGATASVVITRISQNFFWAVSEGRVGGSSAQTGARRRYGSLFRLDTPDIPIGGALTGRGNILVGGSATVNGKDNAPPSGWNCPAKGKDVAGIVMSDTTHGVSLPGCSVSKSCIDGNPKFLQTLAAADTSTYFVYGNATYQSLAATASLVYADGTTLTGLGPVVSGGVCVTSNTLNWGDPNRASPAGACESYLPVMHALGDLHVSGGVGQGILLVDGNLDMTGGALFTGVVIVRGTLSTSGNGAHITGGVMAANISLDQNTVLGNSSIQYSSCALNTVMSGSAYPKLAQQRPWVDMY